MRLPFLAARSASGPLVVMPGQTVTSWSDGQSTPVVAPTAVAVDRQGRAVAYGARAVQQAGDGSQGLTLVWPFTSRQVRHPELAEGYLEWVREESRSHRSRGPIAILVPSRDPAPDQWGPFVSRLSPPGLTMCRALAVTTGLGLEVASSAHLVVIVEANGFEVAVVADGDIVLSRHGDGSSPGRVAAEIRSVLVQIDPDLEWDVAEDGIHAVGGLVGPEWGEALAHALRMKVEVADLSVVFAGARASLEVAGVDRPPAPWRLLRAGMFAR